MNQNRLVINQVAGANIVEYELDLYDNVSIPITKSIIDIQNIAERKSDFSKTITLPGTSNNNNIFSNIFNLARSVQNNETYNFAPDFNPSLKADAILYKNGIAQIQGYLQLTNINVLDDYEIEYEIIIIGKTANLFQDLGEKKLNELDLSAFNHDWTFANMVTSWTPSAAIGYYYGLIDLGLSNNQRGYYTKDWKPQIFLKVIIDAIFKDAGYRYSSSFFTSGHFTKLVVPATQNKPLLTEQQVTDRTFEADRIVDSAYVQIFKNNFYQLKFPNLVQNTSPSGYNTTTSVFTVQNKGNYRFGLNVRQFLRYITYSPGNYSVIDIYYYIKKNGVGIWQSSKNSFTLLSTTWLLTQNSFVDTYCEVGDTIECGFYFDATLTNLNSFEISNNNDSYFNGVASAEITVGDVMELSKCLPSDIKQTDFLLSVINLFNLYIEPSDLDPKRLIIEPRDNFYLNTLVDLTDKVDMSQPIEIKPLAELKFKEYNYEMAADKDAANSDYLLKYSQPYGSAKIGIVNDFVDETFTTKVVFAPTPLLDSKNVGMVFSQIVFRNTSGTRTDGTSKLRLLYAGGLSASFGTNFFSLKDPDGTQHYFNSYPYVGHLDNFNNPTFDVNYYQPKEIAYTTNTEVIYTPNNLYNLYHRKGLLEITDKDSKTVTLFAHLTENEINKLSFRNYYFIDKQYYRLYEIDFDSNSEEPAKLTLLKLAVAPDFNDDPIIINGGGGGETTFAQPPNPNGNDFSKDSDLNVSGQDNMVRGEANLVNSDLNLINGRLNSVFGGGNNQLNNNGGTYLNTNNYQSVRDGEVVINNIDQPLLVSRVLTVSELRNLHTTPIELLASVDGYWTEVYDAYITMFFEAVTPVAYNNHKLHLQYTGDGTHLLEFDNRITTVTTATKQRGVNVTDLPFKNLAIEIHSQGNLGTSGNGKALIELHYRLHRIIQ
jgi:hypothetical protein